MLSERRQAPRRTTASDFDGVGMGAGGPGGGGFQDFSDFDRVRESGRPTCSTTSSATSVRSPRRRSSPTPGADTAARTSATTSTIELTDVLEGIRGAVSRSPRCVPARTCQRLGGAEAGTHPDHLSAPVTEHWAGRCSSRASSASAGPAMQCAGAGQRSMADRCPEAAGAQGRTEGMQSISRQGARPAWRTALRLRLSRRGRGRHRGGWPG